MTADFIEGIIDVVRPPADVDQPPAPSVSSAQEEKRASPETTSTQDPAEKAQVPEDPEPADESDAAAEEPDRDNEEAQSELEETPARREAAETSGDWDAAFEAAVAKPKWVRKQVFKVLAIFWTAHERDLGPITAKNASAIGDELGLVIRHENIRKVIRTRLTELIETSTVEESQPPTFQYEMNDAGAEHFVKEFLEKATGE